MVHLKSRRHPEQAPLLAACTTSSPQPAPVAPSARPYPGVSAEVLFGLRAETRSIDFAAARALLRAPMYDPAAAPQPIEALLDRARHVRRSRDVAFEAVFAEDREASTVRCAAIAAASWTDEAAGAVLAEDCAAVLNAVAARPELRHDTALLMHLAPVVAMLKGLVA